ncbi:hypothetical protein [Brevundimonas sp.]|uniref:hypothetical protein n=1 Tax=Brevundimonas sp. TaxID=1871086 RepID=UPI001A22A601|nr:hypothetical protein [Brevundimonas sp.]MBJ7485080.1 hypothetical protein [Brevundimonas sp.]
MTPFDAVARGLMLLVVRDVPPTKRLWAAAMSGEFEALEHSRLAWAAGCWMTMTRWNLGRDLLVFGLAILAALAVTEFAPRLFFLMPDSVVHAWFYVLNLVPMMLCAAILAFLYPRHAGKMAIILFLTGFAYSAIVVRLAFDDNILNPGWEVMDAPKLVGYLAIFGGYYLAADIGRRLSVLRSSVPVA